MKKTIILMFLLVTINIYAENQVAQVDSMLEGRLVMCVEPGDHVLKGQPLFYVNPGTLKIQRLQARENAFYAFETLSRDKALAKNHNVSLADLQQAQVNLVNAMQDAKTAETNILNSYYFAPFEGVVTMVKSYTGSGIGDGSDIVEVTKADNPEDIKQLQLQVKASPQVAKVASMTKGIMELFVTPGQFVKKGEPLFKVNTLPGDTGTFIASQSIELKNALEYNKINFERAEKLYKSNCISEADYQLAKNNYDNAKFNYETCEVNAKNSVYRAPFDGIVTTVINYSGSGIGDGSDVVEVTKASEKCKEAASLVNQVKLSPQVAQVDSLIEGILHIDVKSQQQVKKGELLFTIDDNVFKNQLHKDDMNLSFCKHDYNRMLKLSRAHSVSQQDFETSKYNLINALAQLENTKLNLKYTRYYAPFDGVITKVVNSNGSAVGSGAEVLDITRTNPCS